MHMSCVFNAVPWGEMITATHLMWQKCQSILILRWRQFLWTNMRYSTLEWILGNLQNVECVFLYINFIGPHALSALDNFKRNLM